MTPAMFHRVSLTGLVKLMHAQTPVRVALTEREHKASKLGPIKSVRTYPCECAGDRWIAIDVEMTEGTWISGSGRISVSLT